MEKIDLEVDDFMNYCDYKNLSQKTLASYEQTLRLFIKFKASNTSFFSIVFTLCDKSSHFFITSCNCLNT